MSYTYSEDYSYSDDDYSDDLGSYSGDSYSDSYSDSLSDRFDAVRSDFRRSKKEGRRDAKEVNSKVGKRGLPTSSARGWGRRRSRQRPQPRYRSAPTSVPSSSASSSSSSSSASSASSSSSSTPTPSKQEVQAQILAMERDYAKGLHDTLIKHSVVKSKVVSKTGKKLAAAVGPSQLDWKFFAIKDDTINAFATAAGYTYITTGLLEAVKNDEAIVAAALAHEMGHNHHHHVSKDMARSASFRRTLAKYKVRPNGKREYIAKLVHALVIKLPKSREQEEQADDFGVHALVAAGYDPRALIRLLRRLKEEHTKMGHRESFQFLSTHPATSTRERRIRELISQMGYTGSSEKNPKGVKAAGAKARGGSGRSRVRALH